MTTQIERVSECHTYAAGNRTAEKRWLTIASGECETLALRLGFFAAEETKCGSKLSRALLMSDEG